MVSEKRGQDELLSKKESADRSWNFIYADMLKGAKVDHQILASIMKQTNDADESLLKRQRLDQKLKLKKEKL